jgi:hypothetical protein
MNQVGHAYKPKPYDMLCGSGDIFAKVNVAFQKPGRCVTVIAIIYSSLG